MKYYENWQAYLSKDSKSKAAATSSNSMESQASISDEIIILPGNNTITSSAAASISSTTEISEMLIEQIEIDQSDTFEVERERVKEDADCAEVAHSMEMDSMCYETVDKNTDFTSAEAAEAQYTIRETETEAMICSKQTSEDFKLTQVNKIDYNDPYTWDLSSDRIKKTID